MPNGLRVRHVVGIAGKVTSKSVDTRHPIPIAGAELELLEGPEEFQTAVTVRAQDPMWLQARGRFNRTVSRADGLFYFLDLPPGGSYKIQVTVPHLTTRFGSQVHAVEGDVPNPPASPTSRVEYKWVDIALISTGVSGRVVTAFNGAKEPVARARVSIQDSTTESKADGTFAVDGLIGLLDNGRRSSPKAVLKVTAKGFAQYEMEIELLAGKITKDIEVNLVRL